MKKIIIFAVLCAMSISSLFGGYVWEYTNKTPDTLYVRVHGGVWPGRFDRKKTLQSNQTQTFEGIGAYCRAGTDVIKAQANKTIDNINNDEWDKNQIAGARCGGNKYFIYPNYFIGQRYDSNLKNYTIENKTDEGFIVSLLAWNDQLEGNEAVERAWITPNETKTFDRKTDQPLRAINIAKQKGLKLSDNYYLGGGMVNNKNNYFIIEIKPDSGYQQVDK